MSDVGDSIRFITYKKGFSLAEVILTMTIVGSVASFTIPALIQNVQDKYFKIAWKASYSIINQASQRMLLDNSGSLINAFTYSSDMATTFSRYMIGTRDCTDGARTDTFGNCFPTVGEIKYNNGHVLTSAEITSEFGSISPAIQLVNGSSIIMLPWTNCPIQSDGRRYCGWIVVDVNGKKVPNTVGRDIFRVWVLNDRIVPQGAQGYIYSSDCSAEGWGCAPLYLRQ